MNQPDHNPDAVKVWLAEPVNVLAALIKLIACGFLFAGFALPIEDGWALAYIGTLTLIGLRKAMK